LFIFWLLFNLFALGMLVLDLRIVHRAGRVLSPREALTWSGLWIALAALFAGLLFFWQGRQPTLEFITGYVLELSLSVDNLFVFLVIFRFFVVPEEQQRGVLFWGIIGAMILRGLFIFAGVGLIHRFHEFDPQKNPVVNALRRWIPMTDSYQGGKFFVRDWRGQAGLYATPLLMVLAIIETTDVLFAVDSIPAVLAITLNAFIVYTSNVFAILGLRSMYFAVSELIKIFRFLHYGMATVLILIGLKMLASSRFTIPAHITLAVIAIVLVISIAASVLFPAERQS
jgi:tellurite resistance protein TerC